MQAGNMHVCTCHKEELVSSDGMYSPLLEVWKSSRILTRHSCRPVGALFLLRFTTITIAPVDKK